LDQFLAWGAVYFQSCAPQATFLGEKEDGPGSPDERGDTWTWAVGFAPSGVPERSRGAGDGVGSPDEFRPKSGRKRGTGGATGPNYAVRIGKMSIGDLVGETSGDTLTSHLQKSNTALKHFVTKFVTWAIDSRTHWSGRSIYRGSMLDDADEMK
jgi:hypothetical protein